MISIFSQNVSRFLEDLDKTLNWNFMFMSQQTIEKYIDMSRQANRPAAAGLRALLIYQPIRWFQKNDTNPWWSSTGFPPLTILEKPVSQDEDTPSSLIPSPVTGFDYLSLQEATQIGRAGDGLYSISVGHYIKNGDGDFNFEDEQIIMIRMGIISRVMDKSTLGQLINGLSGS